MEHDVLFGFKNLMLQSAPLEDNCQVAEPNYHVNYR